MYDREEVGANVPHAMICFSSNGFLKEGSAFAHIVRKRADGAELDGADKK